MGKNIVIIQATNRTSKKIRVNTKTKSLRKKVNQGSLPSVPKGGTEDHTRLQRTDYNKGENKNNTY